MPRLIDADVFKDNMDYVCSAGGWLEPVTTTVIEFVKRHIDAQTEVDAVPVVRCWNCRHRDDAPVDTAAPDFYFCKELRISVLAYDFCRHGERKDE